jgi:glutamate N-acetyltransferase/amino-acid N-acetyltransferase
MTTPAASASFIVEPVEGGITAPSGFRAAGVACGIKANALDFALIVSEATATAAAVFTTNRAQAAPVLVSRAHLARSAGRARCIVASSGCANACTGDRGLETARETAREAGRLLDVPPEHVLIASTGVIGVQLDIDKIKRGMASALPSVSASGHHDAARAIITTDRGPKEAAVTITTPQGRFRVGGMAKGAGMIEPRMATMLAFLTTDAAVEPALLQEALAEAVRDTFNAISVDGDTSTNDTVFLLAGGASGVTIDRTSFPALVAGVREVADVLAKEIVRGGEGATRLVSITVSGAATPDEADRAARTIANSLLVKTAIHGADPNWGRLIAAAGRAGVAFDLERAAVRVGSTVLFENGQPFDDHAPQAASHLQGRDVTISVDLGTGGPHRKTMWTCDLSAEYVHINADYRT